MVILLVAATMSQRCVQEAALGTKYTRRSEPNKQAEDDATCGAHGGLSCRPSSGLNECPFNPGARDGEVWKIGTCCRDASRSTGAVRVPANDYLMYHVIPTRPT